MRELSASLVGTRACSAGELSAGAAAALPVAGARGAGVVSGEVGWRVGAGRVSLFARRVSAEALARPSLEAGAKSGPRFGWSVALAIEFEEAAGGVVFDAHADNALDPRIRITPRCLMTCPFLLRRPPTDGVRAPHSREAKVRSAISRPTLESSRGVLGFGSISVRAPWGTMAITGGRVAASLSRWRACEASRHMLQLARQSHWNCGGLVASRRPGAGFAAF